MTIDQLRAAFSGKVDEQTLDQMSGGIFAAAHVPIWVKDLDLHYVYVTPAWAGAAQVDAASIIGCRDDDFRPLAAASRRREADLTVLSSRGPETRRERVGTGSVTVTRYPLRDCDGRIFALAGVETEHATHEMSERSAPTGPEDADTAIILDAIPARVFFVTANGGSAAANAAARTAIRPAFSLETDGHVIRSEGAEVNKLERWEEADGDVRWMRVDRIPVSDEAGDKHGLVVVATDLTEAVEKEQALTRANEGLKQFAYIASHDLQEPLRKIGTFVDILLDGVATGNADDVAYSTVVIKDSARRASSLIKDLLSWSRLTNRPLDRQPLPFAAVVRDVVHDIRAARPGDDAEVVEDMIDVLVSADATHVRQLIENLVVNALKYRHPDRRPRLVLRLQRAGSGRLQFEIEDNGIGFDQAQANLIFEPFRRLHNERDYTGTGVGLAICARVCERHGWSIEAFGRPGQGATFRVDLGTGGVAPPARGSVAGTATSRAGGAPKGRRGTRDR